MINSRSFHLQFLRSALRLENPYVRTEEVLDWLRRRNDEVDVDIRLVPFGSLQDWHMDEGGSIRHKSGRFFSIDGIRVETTWGPLGVWEQPIINQPEIGFLGLIAKEFDGLLYFLVQAKIEPGNINCVQLSPTLQATKSNYTRVHGGKTPAYLEYFRQAGTRYPVLLDQLQSEQGARFLHKRNRNIIILVDEELPVYEDFCWLTLGQIKRLMSYPNVVNMDLRTVVSGIPYGEYDQDALTVFRTLHSASSSFYTDLLESSLDDSRWHLSLDDVITWFTGLKMQSELKVTQIPLPSIEEWEIVDDRIRHRDGRFFEVVFADVTIGNREVRRWRQPLIAPLQEGISAFVVKRINGILHFLVQAKLECGNLDVLEFAPTVQCITGSYKNSPPGSVPYLDYVLDPRNGQVKMDVMQSEEGGRFYREQNRNMLIEADESFPTDVSDRYTWMTLNQLQYFVKFNNYLNIQARSLIASVQFV